MPKTVAKPRPRKEDRASREKSNKFINKIHQKNKGHDIAVGPAIIRLYMKPCYAREIKRKLILKL